MNMFAQLLIGPTAVGARMVTLFRVRVAGVMAGVNTRMVAGVNPLD